MPRRPITKATPYYSKRFGTTFHSERQYRNRLAQEKGFRNWYEQQRSAPRLTDEAWLGEAESFRDEYRSALNARADMLSGLSKRRALAKYGLTDARFQRHVGASVAWRGRRWVSKGRPPFRRERMLTTRAERMVHPANDAEASRIAQHWNAAKALNMAALTEGEAAAAAALREFDDDRIEGEAFMTDPDDVLDFFETNPDSFESIYEEVA